MINLGLTPNITYHLADTLPTSPSVSDLQTFSPTHIYICEDIPYLYGNVGYGDMWLPVIDLYNSMSQEDPLEIKGYVGSINEMLEVGVYVTYKFGKQGVLRGKYKLLENNGGWIDYEGIFFRTIKEYSNDNLTVVPEYSFYYQPYLTSIDLPNVEEINQYAFSNCERLKNVNVPNVTSLSLYAFGLCKSLEEIRLPKVKEISGRCFTSCSALKNVYIGSQEVVILDKSFNTFNNCNATVHVRPELLSAYQSDENWAREVSAGYVTLVGDYTD
jgi:hypothetical protein